MKETTNKKVLEQSEKRRTLERIDGKYIWREFVSVLIFEKGVLFTIKELFLRPGDTIREFLHYDRNRLVKPIAFLIFCSLILLVTHQILSLNTGTAPQNTGSDGILIATKWVVENLGLVNILLGIFIGLWTSLFFKKSSFNIYEIIILVFFTTGIGNLVYTFFKILESITGFESSYLPLLIVMFYSAWAIGNFFDKKKFLSYFKGFLAYFLGLTTGSIFIIIIGLLLDVYSNSN
jgi:hypothetical protein